MAEQLNTYEYAYGKGRNHGLNWRTVQAKDEKDAIRVIRERHKEHANNSFFPYAGPLLVENESK